MSDINLLPTDNRKKDWEESKKKTLAKAKVNVELTNPQKTSPHSSLKAGNFWSDVRDELKNILSKFKLNKNKQKKEKLYQTINNKNNTQNYYKSTELKQPPISQQFHYQPQPNQKTEKQHDKKIEELINLKTKKQSDERKEENQKSISQYNNLNLKNYSVDSHKAEINLVPEKIKNEANQQQKIKIFISIIILCVLICILVIVYLNYTVSQKRNELTRIESETQLLLQKSKELKNNSLEVNTFVTTLKQVKKIIEGHSFWSNFFEILEKNTHPGVYYTQFQIDEKNLTITLAGNAENYHAMAEQIIAFQSLINFIKEVKISNVQLEKIEEKTGSGNNTQTIATEFVNFTLRLSLQNNVLNQ